MVDSMDRYKSLNIGEMLKFVLDHLKSKKTCKQAVKKLPYLLFTLP